MTAPCFHIGHAWFRIGPIHCSDSPSVMVSMMALPALRRCEPWAGEGWSWAWIILLEHLYLTDSHYTCKLIHSLLPLEFICIKVVVVHLREGPNCPRISQGSRRDSWVCSSNKEESVSSGTCTKASSPKSKLRACPSSLGQVIPVTTQCFPDSLGSRALLLPSAFPNSFWITVEAGTAEPVQLPALMWLMSKGQVSHF